MACEGVCAVQGGSLYNSHHRHMLEMVEHGHEQLPSSYRLNLLLLYWSKKPAPWQCQRSPPPTHTQRILSSRCCRGQKHARCAGERRHNKTNSWLLLLWGDTCRELGATTQTHLAPLGPSIPPAAARCDRRRRARRPRRGARAPGGEQSRGPGQRSEQLRHPSLSLSGTPAANREMRQFWLLWIWEQRWRRAYADKNRAC